MKVGKRKAVHVFSKYALPIGDTKSSSTKVLKIKTGITSSSSITANKRKMINVEAMMMMANEICDLNCKNGKLEFTA